MNPAPGNERKVVAPYGGQLVNLVTNEDERAELIARANRLPSIQLSARLMCDLELLATGAFSPLDRFMGRADYEHVLEEMRLVNGRLFPMPITLAVTTDVPIAIGREVVLRSVRNEILAIMMIEEAYGWDPLEEARRVYGTTDARHPLVAEINSWGKTNVSGPIKVLRLPRHYDFVDLRCSPAQVRSLLEQIGFEDVVAFQATKPLYRVHEEVMKRAAEEIKGTLLIHAVVGLTEPGEIDHYARVRNYRLLMTRYYDPQRTLLSLLPLAMRYAGPRETLWHAIICRNYGANHFIVERDHATPGQDSSGKPFYGPYARQEALEEFGPEIGVKMIPPQELVYVLSQDRYEEVSRIPAGVKTVSISGADLRAGYLASGKASPRWFTRPETASVLAKIFPPKHEQGFCVWFTGLSGVGKSTIAEVLTVLLLERGRRVTVLDGDVVRTHLSKGLGFSKEDRDMNIRRIGFVASEIVRHHGVVICAAVSPYEAVRNECRSMVGPDRFVLAYVDTPLEVCEGRDSKGLYARARRGELRGFTGIDDPYERPLDPEIVQTTTDCSPADNARKVVEYLVKRGFLLEDDVAAREEMNG